MKKLQRLLLIIFIIIIIILIALIIVLKNSPNNEENISKESKKMHNITNYNDYFNVKTILNMYSTYIRSTSENKKEQLTGIFPDFVIQELNTNKSSIEQLLDFPAGNIRIDNILMSYQMASTTAYEETTNIRLYSVKLSIFSENQQASRKILLLVDYINNTYNIIPQEYIEKTSLNIEEGKNIELYKSQKIEANNYNRFVPQEVNVEDICKEYLNIYKTNLVYDIEEAYDSLEESYKKEKFATLDSFRTYVKKIDVNSIELANFKIEENDGKKYICIDKSQNYYTFIEKTIPMQATVTLEKPEQIDDGIYKTKDNITTAEYYKIMSCVRTYINALNINNSVFYNRDEQSNFVYNEKSQKEYIYNLLDNSYIKTNNITKENVLQKVEKLEENQMFYPIVIEKINDGNIKTYKVQGIMKNLEENDAQIFYASVNIDDANKTFSIYPLKEAEYTAYQVTENVTIPANDYNMYIEQTIKTEEVVLEFLNIYKFITFTNPKYTYEKMTEEYRTSRFGSLENYQKYLRANYAELKDVKAMQYQVNTLQNATQYVIKDQYENLYIFDANNPLDYTIRLDTYTLEEPKFNTTYDNAGNYKKVQMNIDKFFQMINRHDYRTSYAHLADSFKQTSGMTTEDEFEKVAKQTFWDHNKVEYVDFEEIGNNTYSYNITLSDLTGQSTEKKNVTIIMQLKDNRDFVMSFSNE